MHCSSNYDISKKAIFKILPDCYRNVITSLYTRRFLNRCEAATKILFRTSLKLRNEKVNSSQLSELRSCLAPTIGPTSACLISNESSTLSGSASRYIMTTAALATCLSCTYVQTHCSWLLSCRDLHISNLVPDSIHHLVLPCTPQRRWSGYP